jgi:hypothetical protein
LGDASDATVKARYSTVLSAISLGKNIRLIYWSSNNSSNYVDWIDETANLGAVKME